MKKIILVLAVVAATVFTSCKQPLPPVEKIVYVPVKDTISDKANVQRIVELEYQLKLTQDSLHIIRDSIGDDLFHARYKLERIKEYVRLTKSQSGVGVAGNSNLKYLPGWINRVLKEE